MNVMTGENKSRRPPRAEVQSEIRSFIVRNFLFGQEDETLTADDSFLDRGIIDSTGVLELTQFLERRFGLEIADEELTPENLDSIGNLTRFIESKTH